MRKCSAEDLKALEPDHECEGCGNPISESITVFVEEYEGDGNDYFCSECVED